MGTYYVNNYAVAYKPIVAGGRARTIGVLAK